MLLLNKYYPKNFDMHLPLLNNLFFAHRFDPANVNDLRPDILRHRKYPFFA